MTLFAYGSALNRQRPERSGLPDARGAAAFRSGLPSTVRGRPGVFSVIHCASTVIEANVTTPTARSTLGKRDIKHFLFFETGRWWISDYIRPAVTSTYASQQIVNDRHAVEAVSARAARNVSC